MFFFCVCYVQIFPVIHFFMTYTSFILYCVISSILDYYHFHFYLFRELEALISFIIRMYCTFPSQPETSNLRSHSPYFFFIILFFSVIVILLIKFKESLRRNRLWLLHRNLRKFIYTRHFMFKITHSVRVQVVCTHDDLLCRKNGSIALTLFF